MVWVVKICKKFKCVWNVCLFTESICETYWGLMDNVIKLCGQFIKKSSGCELLRLGKLKKFWNLEIDYLRVMVFFVSLGDCLLYFDIIGWINVTIHFIIVIDWAYSLYKWQFLSNFSTWMLIYGFDLAEDDTLHITLQKREKGHTWSSPIVGEGQLDPYSTDLEQKRLMLQRFQEEASNCAFFQLFWFVSTCFFNCIFVQHFN